MFTGDQLFCSFYNSEKAWLFLNHLSAIMSVRVLEELDDIGESKNISYRDLTETIIKIKQILMEKMIGKSFQ